MAVPEIAVPTPSVATGRLRRRWIQAVVIGELVGFVPPAATGAVLAANDAGDAALVVGLTIAGAVEGAVLGAAQAQVLRSRWPAIERRSWIRATAAGAGVAWLTGMSASVALPADDPSPALVAAILVPAALVALLAMGWLQWRVLRTVLPRSGRWVPATAVAWLVGVPIPVLALSAVPEVWPSSAQVLVAVVAAVAMGLVVGTITGQVLEGLADQPRPAAPGVGSARAHRAVLAARFAWTALSCFLVESVVVGLAALPAVAFYRWHLDLGLSPEALRLFLLAAAAIPAYIIFALLFMLLSAEATRLLGWRPPRRAELTIADLPAPLLDWARYAIMSHLVHVIAGTMFRSTPVWIWYLRRNGARIGRHVWVNSLQVSDDCLLDIGDEVVIGAGVHLSAHTVERGRLLLAPITLGARTTIGVGAHVGVGVETGEGTQIGAMSVVPKHARLEPHTTYVGIPARPLDPGAT